jgi:hypothetical protein
LKRRDGETAKRRSVRRLPTEPMLDAIFDHCHFVIPSPRIKTARIDVYEASSLRGFDIRHSTFVIPTLIRVIRVIRGVFKQKIAFT